MKKNLVNKKVVSSIGIGIMAFITATSPALTVLAEDNTEQPAPEPAPAVETNTSDSDNQRQTEPVPSEQSQAVDNAQTEVGNAQSAVENAQTSNSNESLGEIGDALNNAQQALGNAEAGTGIAGDLDALEKANAAVDEKNDTLKNQLKDEEGIVQGQVDTVNSSSDGVIDAVDKLTDENVKEIEDSADTAEADSKKKYENAEEAKKAEDQVKDAVDEATSEDGLLGTVEQAEDTFNNAEDAINAVKDQIDRIEGAQGNANEAAAAAKEAEDRITEDADGVEELNKAVEDAKTAQATLQSTLDKAEALKKQIETGIEDIEVDNKDELTSLIEQLPTLQTLNKIELENYIANIAKFAEVKIANGTDETTVANLVNGYIGEYQEALTAHMSALDGLSDEINKLQLKENSNTKAALDNAQDAFKKAKEYEEGCFAACEEVNGIITAINGVQKAQDDLDAAKNTDYESIFDAVDKEDEKGNKSGYTANAEAAYKEWETANETWEAANARVKELEDKYLVDSDKLHPDLAEAREAAAAAEKAKKEKWSNYNAQLNLSAEERIKYLLLKENLVQSPDDVTILKWRSDAEDNYESNYVKVSYPLYDQDGNKIGEQVEYFDYNYTSGQTDVNVLRKNCKYEAGNASLVVSVVGGKPEYKVNGNPVNSDKVHVAEDGSYTIDGVADKKEVYYFEDVNGTDGIYGENGWGVSRVEVITKYGENPELTCYGPAGNVRTDWEPIIENGAVIGIKSKTLNVSYNKKPDDKTDIVGENAKTPIIFKNDGEVKFTGKGDSDRGLSNEVYRQDVKEYRENIAELEKALNGAKDGLSGKVSGREDTDAVKSAVTEFLANKEKLNEARQTVDTENQKATSDWRTANTVKTNVDKAYLGIAGAVTSLLSVTAKTAETAEYDNLKEAVAKHEEAAEALTSENLARLRIAVDKLKAITFPFGYNTPSTTPGGTTGGGTTGGGTGAGGAGGGAGGGVADAAVPVAVVPTAAAPLAGPGAGLVTVEDEVTPLAGPEENEGLTTLEDETTPLAGPADLANIALPIGTVAKMNQMSWWWLLIVAVLGVTGEEMYRRHQKKQREEADIEN